ncbi:protein DESIGUAL 2-like [Wolffia australiana]
MKGNVTAVTAIVALLGVIATILGIAAELTRVKVSDVVMTDDLICDYPKTPAAGLGLAAVVLFVIAHVLIHVFGGCPCCQPRRSVPAKSWNSVLFVYVFSWFALVSSLYLLISAAARNMQRDHESTGYSFLRFCYVVKPWLSAGGAFMGLASVLIGLVQYRLRLAMEVAAAAGGQPGQGIPMGHPQFSSQSPVFVHEDTYARRHIP